MRSDRVNIAPLPPRLREHLPVRHLDHDDLSAAVPIHRHREQDRLAAGAAALAHLLVARVKDQVRQRLLQPAPGELRQAVVKLPHDRAHGQGREAVAAQLLRDRLDLARRHSLHIHLEQRRRKSLLRSLVTLEDLGREFSRSVLRNPQIKHPDPRDRTALVVAASVTPAPLAPLRAFRQRRRRYLEASRNSVISRSSAV